MTVIIELNPIEEAWLNAQTQRQGLTPAEIIKNIVDERIPALNGTDTLPEENAPIIDAKNMAAIALLDSWLKEDATDDPEEIRKSEEEFEELKRNLNANRAATGERLVFP